MKPEISYEDQLRAFRDTYSDDVARGYWDEAIDAFLENVHTIPDDRTFLAGIAFGSAETAMRVEIDSHIRTSLGMTPDYIEPNTDGTWTVMLYETQIEVKVGFGIMPAWPKPETPRLVRDLINDPEYVV